MSWPLHESRYTDEESSLTPIVHNKKAKEIVSYLLNLKGKASAEPENTENTNIGPQQPLDDIEEQESRDDSSCGVECVLDKKEWQFPGSVSIRGIFPSATIDSSRGIFPASTTDSQRARDCILPSARQYKSKHRQSYKKSSLVDEASITSRWSHSSKVKPLFDSDMLSIVSKWSEAGTVDALFDVVENDKKDDPWKAAKRGDLKALMKFHKSKKFNWTKEDQYHHTPLYYACHSGAIVNIDVVPFLLEVTPDNGGVLIEKCRESAINRHVIEILDRKKLELSQATHYIPNTEPYNGRSDNESTNVVVHGYQKNLFVPPKGGLPSYSDQSVLSTSLMKDVSFDSMFRRVRESSRSRKVKKERESDQSKSKTYIQDERSNAEKSVTSSKKESKRNLQRRDQEGERGRIGWPNGKYSSSLRQQQRDNHHHHTSSSSSSSRQKSRSPSTTSTTARRRSSSKDKNKQQKAIIDFIKERNTWVIENQNKSEYGENDRMVLTIHVFEPGQLVYINNCYDVTIHIHGKEMAGMLIENCGRLNVKFGTVVSTCEIFYCKKIAIETKGVCPTFDIDRTDGCVVALCKETLHVTNFVTSKSTNIQVSIPASDKNGGGGRKRVPIPEQFVHKIQGEAIQSSASYRRVDDGKH